jgi:hypothetical protein
MSAGMKQTKNKRTVTLPSISNGKTTGNPPTQNNKIQKKKIVAKIVLVNGFLLTLEKEIKNKQTNTPNIATTPPNLEGTPRSTA